MTKLGGARFEVDTGSDTAGSDNTDTASASAGCGGVVVASAFLSVVVDLESGLCATGFGGVSSM
jgi:hypothetical protein